MADARREQRTHPVPEASSIALAEALLHKGPTPSQVAIGKERLELLARSLESLKEIDREVVAMRHFEGLNNAEVAAELHISEPAASLRYVRAVQRLGSFLMALEDGDGRSAGCPL